MKVFLPLLNSLDPTGWPLKVIPTSGWGFPSWKTINLINWQTCLALSGGPGLCKLWEPWSLASELRLTPRPLSPPEVDEKEVLEKIIMPKNLLVYNRFFLLLCDKVASQHSPGHMGTDPFHLWPSQKSVSFPIICKPSMQAYLMLDVGKRDGVKDWTLFFHVFVFKILKKNLYIAPSDSLVAEPKGRIPIPSSSQPGSVKKKRKFVKSFGCFVSFKGEKICARQPFLFCCLEST